MHPFSILTLGIFVAGYTTARWDLIHQLYELAIFAWDHGVFVSWIRAFLSTVHLTARQTRAAKGFAALSVIFFVLCIPAERIAAHESRLVNYILLR